VRRSLEEDGTRAVLGDGNVFPSVRDAVASCRTPGHEAGASDVPVVDEETAGR
jgi:hypothetical protein